MKHVKQFEALSIEYKLFNKKYVKYYHYILKKYEADNVLFYENQGMLNIVIKYARILEKKNIQKFYHDFNDFEYKFLLDNKAIRFEVFLPEEYLEQLDIEMEANKYNL